MTTTASAPTQDHEGDTRARFVVDGLSPLGHGARARTIDPQDAPAGRYLALEHLGETRLLPLQRSITHVGRGLKADVRVEDAHVSRRHAIFQMQGDRVRLLDDRSANGTFVNGRPVSAATLTDGDIVRIGEVVFRYTEIMPRLAHRPTARVVPMRRRDCNAVRMAA